jgi:hypothetical protein
MLVLHVGNLSSVFRLYVTLHSMIQYIGQNIPLLMFIMITINFPTCTPHLPSHITSFSLCYSHFAVTLHSHSSHFTLPFLPLSFPSLMPTGYHRELCGLFLHVLYCAGQISIFRQHCVCSLRAIHSRDRYTLYYSSSLSLLLVSILVSSHLRVFSCIII